MGVFSRSWQITKLSFGMIKKDKELLLFPLLSGIFSTIFIVAMLWPTIIVDLISQPENFNMEYMEYIIIFLMYLGLGIIATFFNFCIVYTAKSRFEDGNPTVGGTFKFAFSKFHLIIYWGLMTATVGLIHLIIEKIAQNMKGIGQGNLRFIRRALALSRGIITIFVIPAMVYHGLTPTKAIKRSTKALSKTWGESLVRYFGMGLIQFLFGLLGIGLAVLIGFFVIPINFLTGIIITVVFVLLYFLILILVFISANKVYNTALFVYAETGEVPGIYTKNIMSNAFRVKKQKNKAF
ncbi:MAG: DUF6159 family protein [Promethearchaeota archaeon]